jgi:hypothetical protein
MTPVDRFCAAEAADRTIWNYCQTSVDRAATLLGTRAMDASSADLTARR